MTASAWSKWRWPVVFGLAAGAAIAAVDNLLFEGEVSPIVIVGLLLATTTTAGATWGRRGSVEALLAWVWLPAVHFVKHTLGLPDTIHPNTYASILLLAAFFFVVAALGTTFGLLARRLSNI
jgi:hypothetical protein